MSSKFCKNQLYSSHFLVCFITKLYTIFYYLHYFLLFSKVTYYLVWRNLPTNSNYFTKIYLLFSVTLVISVQSIACSVCNCTCILASSYLCNLQHTEYELYMYNTPRNLMDYTVLLNIVYIDMFPCQHTLQEKINVNSATLAVICIACSF